MRRHWKQLSHSPESLINVIAPLRGCRAGDDRVDGRRTAVRTRQDFRSGFHVPSSIPKWGTDDIEQNACVEKYNGSDRQVYLGRSGGDIWHIGQFPPALEYSASRVASRTNRSVRVRASSEIPAVTDEPVRQLVLVESNAFL